jgi:hypothetical protein
MGRFKELSKSCGKCGVLWNEDLSNKQQGRALCLECYEAEGVSRREQKAKYDREHKVGMNRTEKYQNYKFANRQPFWRAINKEIKLLKNRDEIREFISKQMDRILADQILMDYINDTDLIEKTKNK